MSELKFTPGPWRMRENSICNIEDANGKRVAFVDARFDKIPPYSPYGASHRDGDNPERSANAALIAVAPEYYAATDNTLYAISVFRLAFTQRCAECTNKFCKTCETTTAIKRLNWLETNLDELQKKARGEK